MRWCCSIVVHPARRSTPYRMRWSRLVRLAGFILYNLSKSTTRARRSTSGNTAQHPQAGSDPVCGLKKKLDVAVHGLYLTVRVLLLSKWEITSCL